MDVSSINPLYVPNYQANSGLQEKLVGEEEKDGDQKRQAIISGLSGRYYCPCNNQANIKDQIANLAPQGLQLLLKEIATLPPEIIEKVIERALQYMALNDIEHACIRGSENREEFHNSVMSIILQIADCQKIVPSLRRFPAISYEPPKGSTLDNLSLAFSYFSADHPPAGPWEAVQTLQIYAVIIFIPFLASTTLNELFQDYLPFNQLGYFYSIIGCILVGYLLIKVYEKYKPIPSEIKPMRNYTIEARKGNIEPLLGREDVIQRVFTCWKSTHSTVRQHPLLVGPAGVGKSVLFMEIARRIAFGQMPEFIKTRLKNKTMFVGSAALLLPGQGGMDSIDPMEKFLQRVDRIKNEIILGLDEVHALLREGKQRELVKSLLDTSSRGFPYILTATTDKEYQQYIAGDAALARRFVVIHVPVLEKEQVLLSLRELLRAQYPSISVPEKLLSYLHDATNQMHCGSFEPQRQPEISTRILTLALSNISLREGEPLSMRELQQKQVALANLQSQYLTYLSNPVEQQKIQIAIAQISRDVTQLNKTMEEETQGLLMRKI